MEVLISETIEAINVYWKLKDDDDVWVYTNNFQNWNEHCRM